MVCLVCKRARLSERRPGGQSSYSSATALATRSCKKHHGLLLSHGPLLAAFQGNTGLFDDGDTSYACVYDLFLGVSVNRAYRLSAEQLPNCS